MGKRTSQFDSMDKDNADSLTELIIDPNTTDTLRVKILNKLLDQTDAEDFFDTILEEMLSWGECPSCGHENHWLVPEENQNRLGVVTYERDPRVKRITTAEDCPKWQQACSKKKVNI